MGYVMMMVVLIIVVMLVFMGMIIGLLLFMFVIFIFCDEMIGFFGFVVIKYGEVISIRNFE